MVFAYLSDNIFQANSNGWRLHPGRSGSRCSFSRNASGAEKIQQAFQYFVRDGFGNNVGVLCRRRAVCSRCRRRNGGRGTATAMAAARFKRTTRSSHIAVKRQHIVTDELIVAET
jgi:hypothetical protein